MSHKIAAGIAVLAGLVAGTLVILFASVAEGAPIFPPMVGGEFHFRVLAVTPLDADGVPTDPITRSVSLIDQSGGAPIACVDTPDPNGVYDIFVTVGATGVRQAFKGFSYSEVACGGLVSEASENTAYTYPGMSPRPPDLQ